MRRFGSKTRGRAPESHGGELNFSEATPAAEAQRNAQIERGWSPHASLFPLGVCKRVYGLPVPDDLDAEIERQVDAFLNGTPAALQCVASGSCAAPAKRRRG